MSHQTSIYNDIISKIDKIKNNIIKIKEYTDIQETKQKEYLEILLKFSVELNNINAMSEDLHDQFILQVDSNIIKHQDLNLQKKLLINKHIEDVFLPYILYMQILLQNT
jgi:hypothetical protein